MLGSRGLPRFSPWTLTGGSSGLTLSLRSCLQGEHLNVCGGGFFNTTACEALLLPFTSLQTLDVCFKSIYSVVACLISH